jgi:arginine/ornithine N-succinyltransferase beta subunit
VSTTETLLTRDAALERAGRIFADALRKQDALSIEDAAAAAYWEGGPPLEAITDHIRRVRTARAARARGEYVPLIPPLRAGSSARFRAA